jgi:hypothetical protein
MLPGVVTVTAAAIKKHLQEMPGGATNSEKMGAD